MLFALMGLPPKKYLSYSPWWQLVVKDLKDKKYRINTMIDKIQTALVL